MCQSEVKLFEHLPMMLNLSDYMTGPHRGWADAYKNVNTGEIRLDIRLSPPAGEQLTTDLLVNFLELRAIGFAGIARKPSQTTKTEGAQDESQQ